MNEIGSVQAAERPAPVLAPVQPVAPAPRIAEAARAPATLEPAVTLDLSARAGDRAPAVPGESDYRTQFVRDADTHSLVYQVVDPASGDIVVQLPTATVLKARAYAEAEASRRADSGRREPPTALDLSA